MKRTINVLTHVEAAAVHAALMVVIPKCPKYFATSTVHTVLCAVSNQLAIDYERACPYNVNVLIAQLELVAYAFDPVDKKYAQLTGGSSDLEEQILEAIALCLPILTNALQDYEKQRDAR